MRVQTERIVLEFNEYVDRRSVEQSIFISPWPGTVEYEWSGTEVTILLPEPLRENRTYVVSVGTDVIDRRERNRMAAGFTLAFSTGDSIDRGFIAGRVYDEKPEGVMVFAYMLDGLDPDTLNPARLRPDYVTQTGKDGRFTLANVALAAYRVIAVRDEFRDLLYGVETDQFGVPTGDLLLTPERERVEDLRFRLSTEDTTRPFVTSLLATNDRMLRVRCSEPIDSLSVMRATYIVADTLTGALLPVMEPYVQSAAPSVLIVTLGEPADSGRAYRFRAFGITDRAGNAVDTAGAGEIFTGPGVRDTVPPDVAVVGLTDSLRGVQPDVPILFTFSEPVERTAASAGIRLTDSTGGTVERERRWLSPAGLELVGGSPLGSGAWHTIRISLDSLRDLSGNARRDSTRTIAFETFDTRSAGSIEGEVQAEGEADLVLTARRVEAGAGSPRVLRMRKGGRFELRGLPEGRYVFDLYRDSDSSGVFSFGRPFPFLPSEPFTVLDDTLRVRARWSVEGVILRLK